MNKFSHLASVRRILKEVVDEFLLNLVILYWIKLLFSKTSQFQGNWNNVRWSNIDTKLLKFCFHIFELGGNRGPGITDYWVPECGKHGFTCLSHYACPLLRIFKLAWIPTHHAFPTMCDCFQRTKPIILICRSVISSFSEGSVYQKFVSYKNQHGKSIERALKYTHWNALLSMKANFQSLFKLIYRILFSCFDYIPLSFECTNIQTFLQ